MIKLDLYQIPKDGWCERITPSKQYPRHWILLEDIEITLSDNSNIAIPKGFIWDGASIPKWLWFMFPNIQLNSIVFLIHDFLYIDKENQLKRFNFNIFDARKFKDNEMKKWGCVHFSKITITIFHFVIRKIGGFYYSRQFKIPN
jgi:hypothetical protein